MGAVINEGISLCNCMCCQREGPSERKPSKKKKGEVHQAAALPQGSPQECNPAPGTAAGASQAKRASMAPEGTHTLYLIVHTPTLSIYRHHTVHLTCTFLPFVGSAPGLSQRKPEKRKYAAKERFRSWTKGSRNPF